VAVTQEQVLAALRAVEDPDLHRDIVSLGFVKNVRIDGETVDFTIELTTPACPMRDRMKNEAEQRVAALPGVSVARAQMTANVRARVAPSAESIPGVRNVIAVGAGKGGVGKTTAAVNVAVALALEGARVGLIDGDIYGPNVPQMLGVDAAPEVTAEHKLVPPELHGVKVVSMGMLVPPDQAVIWRGPMLHSAIQQFLRDVEWGELDYLVVDLPPGTGDVSLSMAQSVPLAGAILVTTPQSVSISDVRKAVAMFRQLRVPVLGVIENMSHFICGHCGERTDIFGHGGGRAMAEDLRIPFLGAIPIDTTVRLGGDEGRPIVIGAPESPAALAFRDVARQAAAQISIQAARTLTLVNSPKP
jgi:ATP-binding protein involved in chromosome partitioning